MIKQGYKYIATQNNESKNIEDPDEDKKDENLCPKKNRGGGGKNDLFF